MRGLEDESKDILLAMRVLVVHNSYQQRGGEDFAVEREIELLIERGHQISTFFVSNDDITNMSRARLAADTLWSTSSKRSLKESLQSQRPNVVHFQNTFPLISPAAYYAARSEGVPVVQTLHNYRLLCPNALFFRDGGACEDCLGKPVPWPGVLHSCYRGDRAASGVVAGMLTAHRFLKTWKEKVDVYIALTEFARRKFVEGGIPAYKIAVKPNFVSPDPGPGEGKGGYALFVGRLSEEKGVETMIRAWELLGDRIPLKVVGDGSLAEKVSGAAERLSGIEWMGRTPGEQVSELMKDAAFLVFPSTWYEVFPLVIVEAFATGLPVIASDIGNMSSLIDHEHTGLHFRPGDGEDLAAQVERVLLHPEDLDRMRLEARAEFEARYTAERNYERLMEIYEMAAGRKMPKKEGA
jgi:glycosyltransferase involved in cell wall biosynthesis